MVEATVRPVFPRPRTTSDPIVKTEIHNGGPATTQLDLRPPEGQQWTVNFAKIYLEAITAGYSATKATIYYIDPDNSIKLENNAAFDTAGDELSVASFGNGPIVVTQNKYIRMEYVLTDGGTAIVHFVGLAEEM